VYQEIYPGRYVLTSAQIILSPSGLAKQDQYVGINIKRMESFVADFNLLSSYICIFL